MTHFAREGRISDMLDFCWTVGPSNTPPRAESLYVTLVFTLVFFIINRLDKMERAVTRRNRGGGCWTVQQVQHTRWLSTSRETALSFAEFTPSRTLKGTHPGDPR